MAEKTTDNAVLEGQALGRPPAFTNADGDDVESVDVSVAENSPTGTYVGTPLPAATDPDGTPLTYSLSDVEDGEDAKYFALATRHVDDDDVPDNDITNDDGIPNR